MSNNIGKADGFKDEEYIIIPTESFADYAEHPLVRTSIRRTSASFRRPVIITGRGKKGPSSIF